MDEKPLAFPVMAVLVGSIIGSRNGWSDPHRLRRVGFLALESFPSRRNSGVEASSVSRPW
jgi:hypothetical protein